MKINQPTLKQSSLQDIAAMLERRLGDALPRGYIPGKTRIRDIVIHALNVPATRAELIVDQLQAHGLIQYDGDPSEVDGVHHAWRIYTRAQQPGGAVSGH
ncbi:MAG: hypothetical protein Tsb0020_03650 [Haliangiales bacterium]